MTLIDKLNEIKKYVVDIYAKIYETNKDTPPFLRLEEFSKYILASSSDGNSDDLVFKMDYLPQEITIPVKGFTGTIDWGNGETEEYTNASNIEHNYGDVIYGSDLNIKMTGEADSFDTYISLLENNGIKAFVTKVVKIKFGSFKIKSMDGFMGGFISVREIVGLPNTDSFDGMYKKASVRTELIFKNIIFPEMYKEAEFKEEVKLDPSLEVISVSAFENAQFNNKFEFGKNIKCIGYNAFKNTNFKRFAPSGVENPNIIISDGTYIGNNAFDSAKNTGIVYFGKGCIIGDEAFKSVNFGALQIEEGTKLGKGVFANAKIGALMSYGDIDEIPERTFEGANFSNGTASLLIPEQIKKIGPRAFANSKFKQIKIPKSVEIADDAFYGVVEDKIIIEE